MWVLSWNLSDVTYWAPTVLRQYICRYIWKTSVPTRMTKAQVFWHATASRWVSSCLVFQRIILTSAGGSSSEGVLVLLGPEDEGTTIS